MEQNENFSQNVDTLFTNLQNFTKNESVLGNPVTYGEKTLIPVISVTLGYGSGNSAAKTQQSNTGSSSGSMMGLGGKTGMDAMGLGARVSTDAVVVIDRDNVSLLPISDKNGNQLLNKVPQMLSNFSSGTQQQGTSQNQQQGQGQQQQ